MQTLVDTRYPAPSIWAMNTFPAKLTERERTVLEMLANGDRLWWIDAVLDEEYPHGHMQLTEAQQKLGAHTAEHAIALAIRGGHIL